MCQPFFLELSSLPVHQSNLLKLGVKIYSYDDHRSAPSPEPVGWIQHHQLYSGAGADIVMESIALIGGQWVDCASKKARMRANELSLLSATQVVFAAGGRAP
jgi:hypothetical protein